MIKRLICKYLDNLFDIILSHEIKMTFIQIDPIISVLESLEFVINAKKNKDETKLLFIEIELNIIKMKT